MLIGVDLAKNIVSNEIRNTKVS